MRFPDPSHTPFPHPSHTPLPHLITHSTPHAPRYGFIVMDGNGSLFGTLSGNSREVLHKVSVDLPKKHGRGGQSALRFARLRMEKRHNYVRKVRGAVVWCEEGRKCVSVAGGDRDNYVRRVGVHAWQVVGGFGWVVLGASRTRRM